MSRTFTTEETMLRVWDVGGDQKTDEPPGVLHRQ